MREQKKSKDWFTDECPDAEPEGVKFIDEGNKTDGHL